MVSIKRLQTFWVSSETFLAFLEYLYVDHRSPEKYMKSVLSNHLPELYVLTIHGAVRLRQVAYDSQ